MNSRRATVDAGHGGVREGFRRLAVVAGSIGAVCATLAVGLFAALAVKEGSWDMTTALVVVAVSAVAAYGVLAGAVKALGWIVAGFLPHRSDN